MVKKINARCSSGPLDFDLPFTPLKKKMVLEINHLSQRKPTDT